MKPTLQYGRGFTQSPLHGIRIVDAQRSPAAAEGRKAVNCGLSGNRGWPRR